jgi:hypothetical protein
MHARLVILLLLALASCNRVRAADTDEVASAAFAQASNGDGVIAVVSGRLYQGSRNELTTSHAHFSLSILDPRTGATHLRVPLADDRFEDAPAVVPNGNGLVLVAGEHRGELRKFGDAIVVAIQSPGSEVTAFDMRDGHVRWRVSP